MIILGELKEYNKEPIDYIIDNLNYCYCTDKSVYDKFKRLDITTEYAYLPMGSNVYVDNTGKEIDDYNIVIPNKDKYEIEIKLLDKKYQIYLV